MSGSRRDRNARRAGHHLQLITPGVGTTSMVWLPEPPVLSEYGQRVLEEARIEYLRDSWPGGA